jgi:hypothetical protein
MRPSHGEMRDIYQRTQVVRTPTYGIVSGYHTLPYVCLGESFSEGHLTTQVRGTIHVSPQFLLRPSHYEPTYGEIFGEDHVEGVLIGRVFGFMGFRNRPVECKSEHLEVTHLETNVEQTLDRVVDELERYEDITTGVILTPDSRYFPVSVERFIAAVLDDEFRV